ncbi:MAG: hypothetical protein HUJ61_07360, partial [Bacilli bacterium]|nr:hypothetical protein [Bacilli bacterium]
MDLNSIKAIIQETLKKNWKALMAMSFIIFIVIILGAALDLFFVAGTFIIVFMLAILPFYISMIITNIKFKTDPNFNSKEFYMNYRVALIPGLSSSMRAFKSALIGLFVAFLSFLMIYWVVIELKVFDDTQLMNLIYADRSDVENYWNALGDYIADINNPFVLFLYFLIAGCEGLGIFTFVICLLRNTPVFYIQTNFACAKKDALSIFKTSRPKIKKVYNKLLFSSIWPIFILFPLGFYLGATVGWSISHYLSPLIFGGICGAFLFSLPMLPIFVSTQDILFSIFMPYYLLGAREAIINTLKLINQNPNVSEEEKDAVRRFYVERLKQIDAMKDA